MTTKIMHITYDMRIGGTEMVIKNIIDGRDKNQFDMSVLCIESPLGPFAEDLIKEGIVFHQLNRQPGFDKNLIKNIRQIIKQNNIDIIHCHQYTPWVYGVIAAMFTRTKVIFTEHGRFYPDSSTWKRKLINPLLNSFTNQVTAISKATKQALVEFENIPAKDIEVIYNGIEPLVPDLKIVEQIRTELNIPSDAKVMGTVARLDPIKNQTMMLKAFAMVQQQNNNTYLIIVGDGEERQKLESLTDELDIREHVRFIGYITKPVNYIQLMDIFLLSSLSEGTSMTLLEAMSLGKPCVVTDAGGNAEVIKHEYNGLVCENNNKIDFTEACVSMLTANFDQLNKNSLKRFEQIFLVSKMQQNYKKVWSSTKC